MNRISQTYSELLEVRTFLQSHLNPDQIWVETMDSIKLKFKPLKDERPL